MIKEIPEEAEVEFYKRCYNCKDQDIRGLAWEVFVAFVATLAILIGVLL